MTFSHDETRSGQRYEPESERRDQQAVQLYEGGISAKEVGLRLGLSTQKVYRLLSKSGVARRAPGGHRGYPSDHLTEREQEAVQRYADGESAREIAQRLGVTTYQVYRALRFVGIRPRRGRPSKTLPNLEIVQLYAKHGMTVKEIGSRVGLSDRRVRLMLGPASEGLRSPHRRNPGPSPEMQQRAQEFARLYLGEGLSLREVGACFGLSGERVRRVLNRAGVTRRKSSSRLTRDQPAQRRAEAVRLYVESRLTLAGIASRLGVSSLIVARILEKAGVPRRRGSSALTCSQLAQRSEQVLSLFLQEGLTQEEVGERLGVSGATVCRTLAKMGVKLSGCRAEQRMQRNEEIIRAYVGEGLPLQEIGVRFGFHRETVAKILEEAGVRKRASRPTGDLLKQRDGEIVRLYVEERLSLREIAARCGLSVSGIRSILERGGVQARSTSHLVLTREELAQRNWEIVRLHLEEGLAARQISGQLALGVERVYTVLRAAGIRRRRSGYSSAGSSQQRTS